MIKVPPSYESPKPQPLLKSRPNSPLFKQFLYSKSQQIPLATFYETFYESIYLSNNQHQYVAPNAQRIYEQPMQQIYHYQPDLPLYTALNKHLHPILQQWRQLLPHYWSWCPVKRERWIERKYTRSYYLWLLKRGDWPISFQCSISIPPENARKPEVFWSFQRVKKLNIGLK